MTAGWSVSGGSGQRTSNVRTALTFLTNSGIMKRMGRILFFILVSVCLVGFCGCSEPQQEPYRIPIGDIKVGDLEPADPVRLPSQIHFRIFSFEVPIDRTSVLQQGFSELDTGQLRFAEGAAFQANGFLAGFGTSENVNKVSILLEKVQARRKATRNLLVYDDAGDVFSVTMLSSKDEVSWKGSDGKVAKDVFSAGRFAWMVKASPVPNIRGVAAVRILPVYRMGTDNFLSYLARMRNYTPFDVGAFELRMSPGDFVLLGSRGEAQAPDKAAGGDQPTPADKPDEADEQPQELTLNRLLFYPPEKPWVINLYLILCAEVGD